MALFIVCYDLKGAEPSDYTIWEAAIQSLFQNNNKKIQRTTWLVADYAAAGDIHRMIVQKVTDLAILKEMKEWDNTEDDVSDLLSDLSFDANLDDLKEQLALDDRAYREIEQTVRKRIQQAIIFVGKFTDSDTNMAGCLELKAWKEQPTSKSFQNYFLDRLGNWKIRFIRQRS